MTESDFTDFDKELSDDPQDGKIQKLRLLERTEGYVLLCQEANRQREALTQQLSTMILTPQTIGIAGQIQGRILALESLIPQFGDPKTRTDIIGRMIAERLPK